MIIDILGLIGVIASAATGALQAGRVRMDYFGVIIIAFVTSLGGGTIRDLMLNNHPLAWIKDPLLLYTSVSCAMLTILLARYMKYLKSIFLILDAIGLVSFALGATLIALNLGHGMTMACVAAVATGAFGGVLRDLLCNRIPLAFQHELYASIAIVIAIMYVVLIKIGINSEIAIFVTMVTGLVIRLLAIKFKLSLPIFDYDEDKYTNVSWLERLPHPNLRKIIFIRRQNKLHPHDTKLPPDTFASRSHNFQELDVLPTEHLDGNKVVAQEEAIIVTDVDSYNNIDTKENEIGNPESQKVIADNKQNNEQYDEQLVMNSKEFAQNANSSKQQSSIVVCHTDETTDQEKQLNNSNDINLATPIIVAGSSYNAEDQEAETGSEAVVIPHTLSQELTLENSSSTSSTSQKS